jgi:hypothetical protein
MLKNFKPLWWVVAERIATRICYKLYGKNNRKLTSDSHKNWNLPQYCMPNQRVLKFQARRVVADKTATKICQGQTDIHEQNSIPPPSPSQTIILYQRSVHICYSWVITVLWLIDWLIDWLYIYIHYMPIHFHSWRRHFCRRRAVNLRSIRCLWPLRRKESV